MEGGGEVENKCRPPTCLYCENSKLFASAASWKMPIILSALNSADSRRDGFDAGVLAHRGEQYPIELQSKVFTDYSQGYPALPDVVLILFAF